MARLWVDSEARLSPSEQIVRGILDDLAAERLVVGEKLPSVRGLADAALVNPNTVARAYAVLQQFGVVVARNGSGVFVAESGVRIARKQRQAEVLSEFREATRAALALGFSVEALVAEIAERRGDQS